MPAATKVITAAGTQFAISAVLPATHTIAGFEALSFTNIAELVDAGAAGKTFNMVDHSPLGEREVLSLKGSFTQGIRTLLLGRDISDPGQDLILDALDSDLTVSFRITYQNGDIDYITATVNGYSDDIGTIDTIVGATSDIAQRQRTIRLLATGVLTASINDAGLTYDVDGVFTATQASSSGAGTGAEFTVTIAAGVLASIDEILKTGSGYAAAEVITIAIVGSTPGTAADIDVDTIVTAL
jgi:hypothetical protein